MILKSFKYSQFNKNEPNWSVEGIDEGAITFDSNVNLIVAKNASGKSKTLNAIRYISDLFSGEKKLPYIYPSFKFELVFQKDDSEIKYDLVAKNNQITQETLTIDENTPLLNRKTEKSFLFFNELKTELEFKIPTNELATFLKRDEIQHPFLEDIYKWSKRLSHYRFGTFLGKYHLARIKSFEDENINAKNIRADDLNFKTSDEVIRVFYLGREKYGETFVNMIISDMARIGYIIETIDLAPLKGTVIILYSSWLLT